MSKPPRLRPGNTRKSCSNCMFYKRGLCHLYDYRVKATELCDSWAGKK